jgi:hypothetical protein
MASVSPDDIAAAFEQALQQVDPATARRAEQRIIAATTATDADDDSFGAETRRAMSRSILGRRNSN